MSRRAAGLVVVLAALFVVTPSALTGCGEKEERVTGPSRAELGALVSAGLRAAGTADGPPRFRYSWAGQVLRIRMASPVAGGPLDSLLASFAGVRGRIEQFCPKPALLRCRPAFRGLGEPRTRHAEQRSVAALRRLTAQSYEGRILVRRRGPATSLVTPHGEVLAMVRPVDAGVAFSFAGLESPRRSQLSPSVGRLELAAGPSALAALQPGLSPQARRALAGVRRLIVSAPLRAPYR